MWSLIWKEWHEQSWKLGFSCIVLGALALIGLHARVIDDESMVMLVCIIGMILLPILTSASLLGAERSEGSIDDLLALPMSSRQILFAKTLIGTLVCTGPLLIAAIASIALAGNREMSTASMCGLYGRSILVILSLFIWMMATTVRLPTEMRAGLLATGVLIFWLLATQGLKIWHSRVLLAPSPFAFITTIFSPREYYNTIYQTQEPAFRGGVPLLLVALLQIAIAIPLWFFTARRLALTVQE